MIVHIPSNLDDWSSTSMQPTGINSEGLLICRKLGYIITEKSTKLLHLDTCFLKHQTVAHLGFMLGFCCYHIYNLNCTFVLNADSRALTSSLYHVLRMFGCALIQVHRVRTMLLTFLLLTALCRMVERWFLLCRIGSPFDQRKKYFVSFSWSTKNIFIIFQEWQSISFQTFHRHYRWYVCERTDTFECVSLKLLLSVQYFQICTGMFPRERDTQPLKHSFSNRLFQVFYQM